MNKSKLFLSVVALLSLTGCSGGLTSSSLPSSSSESQPASSSETSEPSSSSSSSSSHSSSYSTVPESPLTLYNAGSRLQIGSYNSKDSIPMATYRHKDFGEVPYVELADYLRSLDYRGREMEAMMNKVFGEGAFHENRNRNHLSIERISEHLYSISRDDVIAALVDSEAEKLIIKRYDYLANGLATNNGVVGLDPADSNDGNLSCVRPSAQSKVVGQFQDEIYDLKKYHVDIVEAEGKLYLPFQFLATVTLRDMPFTAFYNGVDFYLSNEVSANATLKASCYSNDNAFLFENVLHSLSDEVLEGELYRFVGEIPLAKEQDPETQEYSIFALRANGEGAVFHALTKDAEVPETVNYKIDWEKIDGEFYLTLTPWNQAKQAFQEGSEVTMRVLGKGGYFNAKTRSKSLADYNYDLLRFQFDEIYGLRPELKAKSGYTDFDSFVQSKGLKEKLLSLDCPTYDEALAEFTMKYVDDGHTSYTDRSLFSGIQEVSGAALGNQYSGPRRQGLFSHLSEYTALRKEAVGEGSGIGLFTEGETAVLRFDQFNHPFSFVPSVNPYEGQSIEQLLGVSTPFAFDASFEQIKENDAIKNVVLDLTCNRGGMVVTIPYLAAFFSKNPTIFSHEANMGVTREFHYLVDLDHNGVCGEPTDTYEGQYNFYILTSDFSFSCGSLLPAVAHDAGVKIIGKQSGGGACSVTCFADACGSLYNTSSCGQSMYHDDEGVLRNNDAGVPVDYELEKGSWYDLTKLNEFVSGLSNPQA